MHVFLYGSNTDKSISELHGAMTGTGCTGVPAFYFLRPAGDIESTVEVGDGILPSRSMETVSPVWVGL